MAQPITKSKYEVTWTAYGSKCVNIETVSATTKTEAKSIIRWRELDNKTEIKDMAVTEVFEELEAVA